MQKIGRFLTARITTHFPRYNVFSEKSTMFFGMRKGKNRCNDKEKSCHYSERINEQKGGDASDRDVAYCFIGYLL